LNLVLSHYILILLVRKESCVTHQAARFELARPGLLAIPQRKESKTARETEALVYFVLIGMPFISLYVGDAPEDRKESKKKIIKACRGGKPQRTFGFSVCFSV
jgi:hypothetical protein